MRTSAGQRNRAMKRDHAARKFLFAQELKDEVF